MASPTPEQISAALTDLIRERLVKGEDVTIPGLGTFRVEHLESRIERREDGQIIMRPPRDEIRFIPEEPATSSDEA